MVFASEVLRSFLQRQQIATLEELKQALGTISTMTVFRKLKALSYRTSYSHRGKYYTLAEIPQFDEQGLWSSRGAWFSRDGTLLATAQRFVEQSPAGFTASELQARLGVEVKQTLLQLYQHQRVERRVVEGVYVYLAREAERKREQRLQREARPAAQEIEEPAVGASLSPELKAAIILFYSWLDERQRRLYAGLEAHKVGYGGDHKMAEFLGLDVHTVARGRRQLLGGEVPRQGVRQAGGGRKAAEKKKPAVMEAIAHLLRHETGGDPMRDLKWSRRAIRKIAGQLGRVKIRVSASTVRRLLKQMGFSLRVNHKRLESGNKNPPPRRVRNRQFTYIDRQRKRFTARANPIISVDAKKKEWIGKFKNSGTSWEQQPQLVNDHDFPSDAVGRAIPYGIYDPSKNQGFVVVGTSRETPAFAVDAITLWWKSCGQKRYSKANELLILADSGGGHSARARGWKYHLQRQLVNPYRLQVTVCHYPPGASKWNPIEHRLFSQISNNWAGRPLQSYETALKYIRTTSTATGLAVCARMLPKKYEKGESFSDQQMQQLMLSQHTTLPAWNYTLTPATM